MDYTTNRRDESSTRETSRDFEEDFFIFEDEDDEMDEIPASPGAVTGDSFSGLVFGLPDEEEGYNVSVPQREGVGSSDSSNSDAQRESRALWQSNLWTGASLVTRMGVTHPH
jgi:hypothetical protein